MGTEENSANTGTQGVHELDTETLQKEENISTTL